MEDKIDEIKNMVDEMNEKLDDILKNKKERTLIIKNKNRTKKN